MTANILVCFRVVVVAVVDVIVSDGRERELILVKALKGRAKVLFYPLLPERKVPHPRVDIKSWSTNGVFEKWSYGSTIVLVLVFVVC